MFKLFNYLLIINFKTPRALIDNRHNFLFAEKVASFWQHQDYSKKFQHDPLPHLASQHNHGYARPRPWGGCAFFALLRPANAPDARNLSAWRIPAALPQVCKGATPLRCTIWPANPVR